MTHEVDELRTAMSDGLLLALMLLNSGDVEGANRLLQDQSTRLHHFQGQVESAIASAAVEREAELVLAGVAAGDPAATYAAAPLPPRPSRVRTLTAAVTAAAVVAAAGIVSRGSIPVAFDLMSGRIRSAQPGVVIASDADHDERRSTANGGALGIGRLTGLLGTTQGAGKQGQTTRGAQPGGSDGLEVLRLLGRPSQLLSRIAGDSRTGPVSTLLNVERLMAQVAQLLPDIAPGATPSLAPYLGEPSPLQALSQAPQLALPPLAPPVPSVPIVPSLPAVQSPPQKQHQQPSQPQRSPQPSQQPSNRASAPQPEQVADAAPQPEPSSQPSSKPAPVPSPSPQPRPSQSPSRQQRMTEGLESPSW